MGDKTKQNSLAKMYTYTYVYIYTYLYVTTTSWLKENAVK